MSDVSLSLLESLTQADAVPGHEDEVRTLFREHLAPCGTIQADRMGNVFCTRPGPAEGPRVLVESHMDEVGFLVQQVTAAGFVKFVALGGWWTHTLLAQRVRIATPKGKVTGVVGSTPPHFLAADKRDKVLAIEDLFIDIGATDRDHAMHALGVTPGCPIAPVSPWTPLGRPGLYASKAFDNRVGVALVIETLQQMASLSPPNTVIGAACAQEEVGLRGAHTITHSTEPDVAIVLEGPPADDTPGFDSDASQGKIGGGPQIRLYDPTMIANPRLAQIVLETAEAHGVPHQIAVRRSGGTDAGAIHKTRYGVPSIVIGVPVRYIHSHVSIIHIEDYLASLELVVRLLCRLDAESVQGLTS